MIELRAMDVVVVDGLLCIPWHPPIMWRGLDAGVHCLTLKNATGDVWSPEFTGIKGRNINYYAGRSMTIHRFKGDCDIDALLRACYEQQRDSKGYDFRQWGLGFVLGITRKKWVDNSNHWTCSEFPYWSYQDLCKITPKDEVLPMPRLFRYNPMFETIFEGVWE